MRTLRFLLSLLLLGCLSSAILWAQSPVRRDSAALAVLAQMAAATGWSRLTVPVDAVATGVVTRYQSDTPDTVGVNLKVKGFRKYRTELQGTSPTTTIVNGHRAAVLTPEGTRWIPSHAALSMRPLVLPFLSDLAAWMDGTVSLRYGGTEIVRGESAHRIEVARQPAPDGPPNQADPRATSLTVWVSTTTGFAVQIQHARIASDNPSAVLVHIRYLSDYRVINGLAVPFRQEEFAEGRPLYVLQLTQVQFNVGLPDSHFDLPAAQD